MIRSHTIRQVDRPRLGRRSVEKSELEINSVYIQRHLLFIEIRSSRISDFLKTLHDSKSHDTIIPQSYRGVITVRTFQMKG